MVVALAASVADAQERAPNGQIYRELVPFVGLDGVRLQITGLSGGIFNVRDAVADPEKAVTGLSRTENQQLKHTIRADIAEVFQMNGVPLLPSGGPPGEGRPFLAINISWARVKPDTITVQIRVDLLEAARLVKDPSRIVWTSTWGDIYNGVASGPDLSAVVRSVTRGHVELFARLYARAHAKAG
jgi:hypothetical protein